MRIAQVTGKFPDVSGTFVLDQVTGLMDLGHDVTVFADRRYPGVLHEAFDRYGLGERTRYRPRRSTLLRRAGGNGTSPIKGVLTRPCVAARAMNVARYGRDAASFRLLLQASPWLSEAPFDATVAHFGQIGLMTARLRDLGAPTGPIATIFHGGGDITTHPERFHELFRRGELMLPVSDAFRRRLIELGCPEDRIVVHKVGVDCERFAHRPRSPRSDGVVRLVSIGRLVEHKGIEHAIRALGRLPNLRERIRYTIVGDGPLRQSLQSLTAEAGLSERVDFLGAQTHQRVLEVLDASDIMVLPSVTASNNATEGIPVVLMEAMAMGMPVIASRHAGIPELVRDGESGFLTPERDDEALAERIRWLIEHPERWAEMGAAGRRFVEEHHNLRRQNERLASLLADLAAGRGPAAAIGAEN